MDEVEFFRGKVKTSLVIHCEARGIPEEESGSVIASFEKKYGVAFVDMNYSQLKRMSREIPPMLVEYIGTGEKRRPLHGKRLPAGFGEVSAEG